MRSLLLSMTAAGALFASAASAVTVSIDTFDTTQSVIAPRDSGSGYVGTATSLLTGLPDVVGGVRSMTATRTSPSDPEDDPDFSQVKARANGGQLSLSTDAGTVGFVTLAWNAGGANLLSIANDAIRIGVDTVEFATVNFSLTIDGSNSSKNVGFVGSGNLDFLFTEFAGADLSDVENISLTISGPAGFDTSFSFIEATHIAPVPLPAGAVLVISGLGAFGLLRRKRGAA